MYDQSIAPTLTVPRSHFDLSCNRQTTIDFDYLYPALVFETIPGDTISFSADMFGRWATLLYPQFTNTYLDMHVFWAPERILCDNAKKFYGEQINPGDSIDYTKPIMAMPATTGAAELSLADYFKIPTKIPDLEVQTMPFRMYQFCINEFFRDQNLQDSFTVDTDRS